MRARWLVLVSAVALLAACGAAPYSSTQGARIVRYSLESRLMHRSLKQVLVVPAGGGAGRPLLVLLHGRSSGADQFLGDPMFTPVMEELNRRKAICYTHPFRAEPLYNMLPDRHSMGIVLSTDTTLTIESILYTKTATRFP